MLYQRHCQKKKIDYAFFSNLTTIFFFFIIGNRPAIVIFLSSLPASLITDIFSSFLHLRWLFSMINCYLWLCIFSNLMTISFFFILDDKLAIIIFLSSSLVSLISNVFSSFLHLWWLFSMTNCGKMVVGSCDDRIFLDYGVLNSYEAIETISMDWKCEQKNFHVKNIFGFLFVLLFGCYCNYNPFYYITSDPFPSFL